MNERKDVQLTSTPLLRQQVEALRRMNGRRGFALLMEQGTGKTLALIEDALRLYAAGEVEAMMVLAPNGVHESWILEQIPLHVPPTVPLRAAYYATTPRRKEKAALAALIERRPAEEVLPFRVLTMSYDSLLTDRGFKFAEEFMRRATVGVYIVADESQRIKSHDKRRTKRALNLRRSAKFRRISTGTVSTNSPLDLFSQYAFIEEPDSGDPILGTDSFAAFKAEYCELLPPEHGIMRHVVARMERARGRTMSDREKAVAGPRLIAQDEHGRPKYKNLDRLQALIAPHSYRVLKEECLDLPPKVYETRFFHLSAAQRVVYDRMADELRYILEDGTLLTASKLVAMAKLRQITSGFLLMRDGTVSYVEDNPRIELLASELEDNSESTIIWSQYKEEQRNIQRLLGSTCETVNGETPMNRRREIRDEFQAGNLQYINAHPATMGVGYTLTTGKQVVYYSNGYSLEDRLQSEDRTHRIGTVGTIVYRDFVAIDTKDDDVVWALQHKLDTAAMINGDPARPPRFASFADRQE